MISFSVTVETSILKWKLQWLLLGSFLDKFGRLFISTSGHIGSISRHFYVSFCVVCSLHRFDSSSFFVSSASTQIVFIKFVLQESYYNLGRAMHQLGLLPAAMHYYKQALDAKPMIEGDKVFDLSQEAAFNLSLIYQGLTL